MLRRVIATSVLAGVFFTVPASAEDSPFTFGRVARATPDSRGRLGVQVSCFAPTGCKLELILRTTGDKPVELGRVYTQLISGTREINYVMLSKRKLALLTKTARTAAAFTGNVTMGDSTSTYVKPFTIRRPKPATSR